MMSKFHCNDFYIKYVSNYCHFSFQYIHCSQHCLQSLSHIVLEVFSHSLCHRAKAFGPEPGSIHMPFPS